MLVGSDAVARVSSSGNKWFSEHDAGIMPMLRVRPLVSLYEFLSGGGEGALLCVSSSIYQKALAYLMDECTDKLA